MNNAAVAAHLSICRMLTQDDLPLPREAPKTESGIDAGRILRELLDIGGDAVEYLVLLFL